MKTFLGLMICAFMVGCNEDNTASIKALETASANLEQAVKALEAATKNHKDFVAVDKAKPDEPDDPDDPKAAYFAQFSVGKPGKPYERHYEYKTIYTSRNSYDVNKLQNTFNVLGKEGWKFIGFCMVDGTNGRVCVFSRELRLLEPR